jgi:hypothetical protein
MGTLGKDGSNPLIFDGRPESWPPFKKALHQLLDKEGYGWVVEGGDVFCAMLQAASAKAAKSTVTSGKGTVSTNVADYQKKDLQTAFKNALVTTSEQRRRPLRHLGMSRGDGGCAFKRTCLVEIRLY